VTSASPSTLESGRPVGLTLAERHSGEGTSPGHALKRRFRPTCAISDFPLTVRPWDKRCRCPKGGPAALRAAELPESTYEVIADRSRGGCRWCIGRRLQRQHSGADLFVQRRHPLADQSAFLRMRGSGSTRGQSGSCFDAEVVERRSGSARSPTRSFGAFRPRSASRARSE
jgi:hypothetical protein